MSNLQTKNWQVLPCLHSNGTSKEMLLRGWKDVLRSINAMQDSLEKAEFNPRDYYPVDGLWEKALSERREFNESVMAVRSYVDHMIMGIHKGGHHAVSQQKEDAFEESRKI